MTNTNHNNDLPCAFAEMLVAVLYNEATMAERQEFRKHFGGCIACRDELASFDTVRNSLSEWRAVDFDSLKTPAVVLPEFETMPISKSPAKSSWIERASKFLLPFGGQLRGVAAFAAFAMCITLLAIFGYGLANRTATPVVAGIPKIERTNPIVSNPTPIPVPQPAPMAQSDSKQTDKNLSSEINTTNKRVLTTVKAADHQEKSAAVAVERASSLPPPHQPMKHRNTRETTIATPPKPTELAIETVDDLEDNSLRLSDLLDDNSPSM